MAKTSSRRTKNRQSPSPRKRQHRRPNLHIVGVALVFFAGIALGAYALNRVYIMSEEAARLEFAERLAAEHAHAEYQKRLRNAAQQAERAKKVAQQKATTQAAAEKEQKALQQLARTLTASPPTSTSAKEAESLERQHLPGATEKKLQARPKTWVTNSKSQRSKYTPSASATLVALVIDDVGYKRAEGERTLALPGKATIAVLPYTPFAENLALQAPKAGKEVILHAPMEPKRLSYWGEGLASDMSPNDLRHEFVAMINSIPNLVGVNNHMGSQLTENRTTMYTLMAELPARGLYFVDSRTTAESQAYGAAVAAGVDTYSRDVFLDHSRNPNDIREQLQRLIKTAEQHGMALGIGHPYPETLKVLETEMPRLKKHGIEFVTVSELLNAKKQRHKLALSR